MIIVHYLPAYWGIESEPVDRSFVTKATLHEVLPPFRESIWAFRIRVSHKHWLHIGKFGYTPEVGRWGLDADVDEISTWRGPNGVEPSEEGQDPVLAAADEVRQVE
jgi:hypothetical protein